MYCTKCGKEINYDSRFCVDCAKELAIEATLAANRASVGSAPAQVTTAPEAEAVAAPTQTEAAAAPAELVPVVIDEVKTEVKAAPAPNSEINGKGKAIASLVMSCVSFLLAYLSIFFVIFAPGLGVFMLIAATPLAIISLVQGIKCIKIFSSFARAGLKKPVATLVMGIIGLVTAATSLMIILIYFITFMGVLALLSSDSYYY